MTRRKWTGSDDDDEAMDAPAVPDSDFSDSRPGYAHGATVWGEAPRGGLEAVEEVLDGVLGQYAGSPSSDLQKVAAAWERIAGEAWKGTRPVRISGQTLVVEVPSGMVASRLQFDAARVVRELRGLAGGGLRSVRFSVTRGETSPSSKAP